VVWGQGVQAVDTGFLGVREVCGVCVVWKCVVWCVAVCGVVCGSVCAMQGEVRRRYNAHASASRV
jgi:hypothetical protein